MQEGALIHVLHGTSAHERHAHAACFDMLLAPVVLQAASLPAKSQSLWALARRERHRFQRRMRHAPFPVRSTLLSHASHMPHATSVVMEQVCRQALQTCRSDKQGLNPKQENLNPKP
jgi:hypothetical protein